MAKKICEMTAKLSIVSRRLKVIGEVPTEFRADGVVKEVFTYGTHEPIESPDIDVRDGGIYVSAEFYAKVMQKYNDIYSINAKEASKVLYFTIKYTLA